MKGKYHLLTGLVLIIAITVSFLVPVGGMDVKAAAQVVPLDGVRLQDNSIEGNEHDYFYQEDGTLHLIVVAGRMLKDYSLDDSYHVSGMLTVNLPAYDTWIGYHHKKNGQNFIAVGYTAGSKKAQKALSIVRYSKNWKKEKTASLKRNTSQILKGISGIGGGNFAESGNDLYLYAVGREFSQKEDSKIIKEAQKKNPMALAVDHSRNIGFEIDTKRMKIQEATLSYSSPCSDTYAVYDKKMLFLADRDITNGLNITSCEKGDLDINKAHTMMPFKFKGDYSDIYYKCKMTGVESSKNNIIMSGHSVPFGYTNAGMTGYDYKKVCKNLFIVLKSKSGNKSKVKWLTSYKQNGVSESRIIKINDQKYAVIYCGGANFTSKTTHIVYIDGQGKRIGNDEEIFPGIYIFDYEPNPIIYRGNIIFARDDVTESSGVVTNLYSIPVK